MAHNLLVTSVLIALGFISSSEFTQDRYRKVNRDKVFAEWGFSVGNGCTGLLMLHPPYSVTPRWEVLVVGVQLTFLLGIETIYC